MKKIILSTITYLYCVTSIAQTNLVPNHNFQKVTKKIKEKGQIAMASPWISPTLAQADLFIKALKEGEVSVPNNIYGAEEPMSGDNYAGFIAYSYKEKIPRSYLQVKLTEPLKQDEEYCITFHVSLSDLSKYACNFIGAYLSTDAVSANNSDVLQFEPQIVSRKQVVYEKQFYWTPICAKFKAKGGEQYLTIGNFTPELKLKINKVKRPQGFNTPQINEAYYFLDNISVTLANTEDRCDCDFTPGVDDIETVNSQFKSDLSGKDNKSKIIDSYGAPATNAPNTIAPSNNSTQSVSNNNVIYFDDKNADLKPEEIKKLDAFIALLKNTPNSKIELFGYIDESEKTEEKLDGRRVSAVYKYVISKGLVKENVLREMKGVSTNKDAVKNKRVEIIIKN
ncbi:MAG: OmpA family protein [Flavobacteriales bacterium]|nr:OmpA family protein [Flavobacteriales bacterium]